MRRDFEQEAENPFEESADEPDTGDIIWQGSLEPDSTDIWEEAGLIEPIEADRYELQERTADGSWQFVGIFSSNEDLQWVLEKSDITS